MYYDIVITYADPSIAPRHFWNGYEERHYAYSALASVGRIVRESHGYGQEPITYADPEHPVTNYGNPDTARIELVQAGQPYATITTEPTPHKRRDAGQWANMPGRKRHSIQSYHGETVGLTRCGRRVDITRLSFAGTIIRPNMCSDCIREGARLANPADVKLPA